MSAIDHISDNHAKVSGMMHLLTSGDFESKDRLYQTLEDVYNNFTSIHKAIILGIDELNSKFREEEVEMSGRVIEFLIIFCKCSLRRIFEEDGIMVRESHARLLAEIELQLVDTVEYMTNWSSSQASDFSPPFEFGRSDPLMDRIADAYGGDASICYHLINYDVLLDILDLIREKIGFYDDYSENMKAWKERFSVLINYLELLNKGGIHGDNSEKVLIAVENVTYKMAHYLFLRYLRRGEDDIEPRIRDGQLLVLKALVMKIDSSCNALLMSDELLRGYVKCVQEHCLVLMNDGASDLTDTLKDQLKILHEGLSYLTHLLVTYTSKHDSEQLSNIRLDFQAFARNVGSIICSYLDNPEMEEMSIGLFELIGKIDIIKGEIINAICCVVLEETRRESSKHDHMGSLILLLKDLKEFMDHKSISDVIWNDQENLVLFIFYLIQNGHSIGADEVDQNTFQFDIALSNNENLKRVLIQAQVVAFKMACPLLRRHGKFHWWELYLRTRAGVNSHMCVGILKALVFSLDDTSTPPLTDELLIAYVECVQDSLIELQKYTYGAPLKDEINILHEGLQFLVHLLISYGDEKEKLSHVKVNFQDLLRNVGSAICSCFSDWLKGDMKTGQRIELSDLVANLNRIGFEATGFLNVLTLNKVGRESPKTDQLGSLNLLLENCKGLLECETNFIVTWKDQFTKIYMDLVSFKSFITSTGSGDDESQNLCNSIIDAAYVTEYVLATFSVGVCPAWCTSLWVPELMEHVDQIKEAVMEANKTKGNVKETYTTIKDTSPISHVLPVPTLSDVVVGFDKEMKLIKEQLSSDLPELDVISIIGMPGLGKTTLARKVYEDHDIVNHFTVRAWCSVSQEYNKKELLLTILGSKIEITDEIKGKDETDLCTMVHQELKGRRYLIVLDDIWSVNAFMELRPFFPRDSKRSRIMLTSRSKVTGTNTKHHSDPIEPGFLTDKESWNLLERKVYGEGKCPLEMYEIGNEIARKCGGLPLAITVVAGILAKSGEKRQFWKQVAGNLSSYRGSETHVKTVLELSYKHLPHCLKPMFLYLGAFPEDAEIHADKLMRLWMGEGFVQKTESSSLESESEKNLTDLIDRSLVMVAKRRWDGRVKSCHVHDLLRDLCLAKAKEEKFMQQVHIHRELRYPVMYRRRLSILLESNDETASSHLATYKDLLTYAITPPIYSILFFPVGSETFRPKDGDLVPVINSLKLLKVFGAEIFKLTQYDLDMGLIMLVHLRYLSFGCKFECIPPSISRLRSLETLIINVDIYVQATVVPETIWEMTKLRHLHISPAAYFIVVPENPLALKNLQTLSTPFVYLGEEEKLFRKVPRVKKLKCDFIEVDSSDLVTNCTSHTFPDMESLGKIESLKANFRGEARLIGEFKLPSTLKKLSIVGFRLNWSQISIFMALPNLEALKLKVDSVWGDIWEMGADDEFKNLKFLKLQGLEIKEWSASADNFPSLERLVLEWCRLLEKIPEDLGEFYAIQNIEVIMCGDSAVSMAKDIQKVQEENENALLKFYIHSDQ